MRQALLSIHDLMPETRTAVSSMLAQLFAAVPLLQPEHITLLVVPGRNWRPPDIEWLHRLAADGHPLAGHGWCHRATATGRSACHHLHSLLLSGDAAEHLSRPAHQVFADVLRCHAWFVRHDLPVGPLYVPPAWAAGAMAAIDWSATPFALLETLSGVCETRHSVRHWLPLSGYEADSRLRVHALRVSNYFNRRLAVLSGRALRIGLHPYDLQYGLAQQLLVDVQRVGEFIGYPEYIAGRSRQQEPALPPASIRGR